MSELLDRLRRRRDAYRAILAGAGDVGALLAEAEAMNRAMAPVRERWDEIRGTLDPGVRREIEEIVEETREVLAELVRTPAARAARAAYGA